MSIIKKIKKVINEPEQIILMGAKYGLYNKMNDEEYIKKLWRAYYKAEINLETPTTLCEKLQWLKLYYRKPIFTTMVDKYEAKKYVEEKMGNDDSIIPTLAVWDNVEDIDMNELPEKFILKATHNSGGLVICQNKDDFDLKKAQKKLSKILSRNFFYIGREWPYKNVKPRIIAEPLIEELGKKDSIEYKITCFNGKVAFITICTGIAHSDYELRKNDHFDKDFNKLDWYVNYKPAEVTPKKPAQWEEMIYYAEKLAEDIPYLRVDVYLIDGKIKFGEMTFYTWGGFMKFQPKEWDKKLGEMLILPSEKVLG
ncbi:ATP-grasp fold amidoligase family protein [Butyrivibrio hungatei]|uniref:TupA-like ATPgrasp polysaccharide biosynthesis protein n=1 Tax=Butyrivibrio hungatei TaxID=185008 RepID=A0A1D9NYU4_9FIRM|nr:ATP-grasp fold amidoligase family protein [Butyrivibrio hungatei]AOZ95498.1 TupA-like ATPgrasp polysaccharide biosynthesis protein [Butyrivibrio hungatei]